MSSFSFNPIKSWSLSFFLISILPPFSFSSELSSIHKLISFCCLCCWSCFICGHIGCGVLFQFSIHQKFSVYLLRLALCLSTWSVLETVPRGAERGTFFSWSHCPGCRMSLGHSPQPHPSSTSSLTGTNLWKTWSFLHHSSPTVSCHPPPCLLALPVPFLHSRLLRAWSSPISLYSLCWLGTYIHFVSF